VKKNTEEIFLRTTPQPQCAKNEPSNAGCATAHPADHQGNSRTGKDHEVGLSASPLALSGDKPVRVRHADRVDAEISWALPHLGQLGLAGEFALPQIALFKVECGVLEFGREHDKGRFAAGLAKVACATKNAEMPHGPDIG
jgi:hypothetical protein